MIGENLSMFLLWHSIGWFEIMMLVSVCFGLVDKYNFCLLIYFLKNENKKMVFLFSKSKENFL